MGLQESQESQVMPMNSENHEKKDNSFHTVQEVELEVTHQNMPLAGSSTHRQGDKKID